MNESMMQNLMADLSLIRPIFHSEADFQFSLANLIKKTFPTAEIRLERPFSLKYNKYLDILVILDDKSYPIELKYKTTRLNPDSCIVGQERYTLKHHGAKDLGAYYFLKDLERLEELSKAQDFETGFAILLTNDLSYQTPATHKHSNYAAFALTEGSEKSGDLKWLFGKMLNKNIVLQNSYQIHWQPYSKITDDDNGMTVQGGDFAYVLLSVPKTN